MSKNELAVIYYIWFYDLKNYNHIPLIFFHQLELIRPNHVRVDMQFGYFFIYFIGMHIGYSWRYYIYMFWFQLDTLKTHHISLILKMCPLEIILSTDSCSQAVLVFPGQGLRKLHFFFKTGIRLTNLGHSNRDSTATNKSYR